LREKIEVSFIFRFSARAARPAISTTRRFRTGRAPGNPRQTGQVLELGSSPKRVEHPQNIFESVLSCACISRPITGSYLSLIQSYRRQHIEDSILKTARVEEGSGRLCNCRLYLREWHQSKECFYACPGANSHLGRVISYAFRPVCDISLECALRPLAKTQTPRASEGQIYL